jgi:hypothetical protein
LLFQAGEQTNETGRGAGRPEEATPSAICHTNNTFFGTVIPFFAYYLKTCSMYLNVVLVIDISQKKEISNNQSQYLDGS